MPWITLPEPKYPLTESEKKWLHERKNVKGWAFCLHCPPCKKGFPCTNWLYHFCPTEHQSQDFEDAAKFEARVAAKLAMRVVCHHCPVFRPCRKRCDWERIKYARLSVEKEMEAEGK